MMREPFAAVTPHMSYDVDPGPWTRRVSTSSNAAQRRFDRGLGSPFACNPAATVACFSRAAGEDMQLLPRTFEKKLGTGI